MPLLDYGCDEIDEIFHINAINSENQIKLDNVFINNIYKHGLLFGYKIYVLLEDHHRILGYGILIIFVFLTKEKLFLVVYLSGVDSKNLIQGVKTCSVKFNLVLSDWD